MPLEGRCISKVYLQSNRAVCRSRVSFYEYFKPRLTQIVLSATRRESNLTSRIGTSRIVYLTPFRVFTLAFFAFRRHRHSVEHAVTYRLHHLSRSSSFIHSRPSPRRSPPSPALSLLRVGLFYPLYTRTRIHLPYLFLPFLHRRFISASVTAAGARGSSIARSETRRNDLQRDLWIHPLLSQSYGLERKAERKNLAERERTP